ncbi:DNA-directed DNA polymerase II small subunit [Methanolobus sp.]|jgi:DNA polymerase II small subunit|uniref:DNA-directed DNA polymerase II small subunit n=1 Tax=Methanolobus sp. TaxID=1874737 RepID=UPI0025FC0BE2|nr:DNA-directed DNA polymerase II small subunit [Methanolobus sp.]
MNDIDIITAFIEEGYQISPKAVDLICSHCSPAELVTYILENIDLSVLVIDLEHIDLKAFSAVSHVNEENLKVSVELNPKTTKYDTDTNSSYNSNSYSFYQTPGNLSGDTGSICHCESPVSIISDITDNSTCVGEYMEFVQFFRNRYSRLSDIIRSRITARPIESLKKGKGTNFRGSREAGEISIIGMISEIKSTTNGHKIVEVEDPTGSFSILIRMADKELFEQASHFVLDEVVGFTGTLTNDAKLMIAQKITLPDLPNVTIKRSGSFGKAILTSDIHIGSSTFLEEPWERFLDFLNGDTDNDALAAIAKEVRYLLVAGDLVDGVGIYPGQEHELSILDVYDQYKKAAEYFSRIPSHIQIIISPGNHDAVRQAEPQPKLPEIIRADFPDNVTFVGNPSVVDLDGVKVMLYHGRSIDDLVASVPGVSYADPTKAMVEMMKFRHLSPIYGSRVSIAPEKKDYFVIGNVPDILHCGHVHTVGVEWYKNVLLINSGTWQDQTEFQKRVNVVPTPAQVPVVDLATLKTTILKFDE